MTKFFLALIVALWVGFILGWANDTNNNARGLAIAILFTVFGLIFAFIS